MESPAAYDPPSRSKEFLPKRWEMVLLLFTGITVVYTLRVNISVAAQEMRDELDWSEAQKGLVLSAFYWGYALGQIPTSRIVQAYGAKWIFGFSVLVPSALTIFVPPAAKSSFGLALFMRAIIGFFESASFPAVFHFFPIWVPLKEKTFLIPVIVSGMYMGEIIGFSLSGALVSSSAVIGGVDYGGWPSVFYLFGVMGVLWFPFWAIYAYELPSDHPHISAEELQLIREGKLDHHVPRSQSAARTPLSLAEDEDEKRRPLLQYTEFAASRSPVIQGRNPSRDAGAIPPGGEQIIRNVVSDAEAEEEEFIFNAIGAHSATHKAASQPSALSASSSAAPFRGAANREAAEETDTERAHLLLSAPPHHLSAQDVKPNDLYDRIYDDEQRQQSLASMESEEGNDLGRRIPWKAFFTNIHSITLLANSWAFGFVGFTMLSEMPSFLSDELGFDISSAGIMSVFPYLALFIATLLFGRGFNYLQQERSWPTDSCRKLAQLIAYVGSIGGLLLCGYLQRYVYVAYGFIIISQAMLGAAQVGLGCAYSDVSPTYSSSLNSVGNTMAALAGIVGPLVVSACLEENPGIYGWRVAFFITAAFGVVAMTMFYKYQTSKIVPVLNTPCAREDIWF